MSFTPTPLNRLTLVQKTNQILKATKAIEFSNKAGCPEYEKIFSGGYEIFNDVIQVKAGFFNESAFIQSDSNLSKLGTGLQANNRQDVNKQWVQTFKFVMPDADAEDNIDFFVINYRKAKYVDKLLTEEFVNNSLNMLNGSFDTLFANRFIFGVDRVADGTTQHYAGLKDLISNAKAEDAIDSVDDIDVLSTTETAKHIELDSSLTDLECFSQLNNLMFKMGQLNTVFAYQNSKTTSTYWINKGTEEANIKGICWNSFIEKQKARNYQFYKQLQELYNTGKLVVIAESTLDAEKVNRDTNNTGIATTRKINSTTLGLAQDEILFFDANSFIGREYDLMDADREETTNNATTTVKKLVSSRVADYLPSGAVCVIKVPTLMVLDSQVNP